MNNTSILRTFPPLTSALPLMAGAVPTMAETIVGLAAQNRVLTFDSANPGMVSASVEVTGLSAGETLVGIDFRPLTGELYALGRSSRIYVVNAGTGAATAVGSGPFATAVSGDAFGFDFNPTVDRIRLVSDNGQNLRLHPVTGAVAATDLPLNYAAGDVNQGQPPQAVGAAYTQNLAGATTTTLYVMDSVLDVLVRQIPPNNGTLNTVGSLGVNITDTTGFDISGATGTAYASFVKAGESWSGLYTVDLSSGAASWAGDIGSRQLLLDIAVVPEPGGRRTVDASAQKVCGGQ
ncbi:MAG: DUF4394 domain-containing protein [Verrucomicrobia bacterium]|nr:DUF4394 domain-containing protein [Verrucomicrobiota bacterium]